MKCERLVLRALSLEEMERLKNGKFENIAESVLLEDVKSAVAYKTEQMHMLPREVHPWVTYWMISEQNRRQGIGLVGGKHLPDEQGYVEIGYVIAEECRGHGYMAEALSFFLDWLYRYPFCNGAVLSIQSGNLPSVRTAEKCGFSFEKEKGLYRIYRYDFL